MGKPTCGTARAVCVVAIATALVMPCSAQDEPAADGGLKVALVDLDRLQANYVALHEQERALGQWLQSRRQPYEQLADYRFLSATDFQEVLVLVRKGELSEDDEQRLQELREISDKNDEKYRDLRGKTDRTAEESAAFNALQEMFDSRTAELAELLKQVQPEIAEELHSRRGSALAGLMSEVEAVIAEIAAGQGYNLVLDTDAVFFGGTDITDAVIEKLNAGFEAESETETEPETETEAEEPAGDQQAEGGGQEGGEQQ